MGMESQIILANRLRNEKLAEKMGISKENEETSASDLAEVKGIGPATLAKLISNGITTKAQLIGTEEDRIKEIVGNPLTVKSILNSIKG